MVTDGLLLPPNDPPNDHVRTNAYRSKIRWNATIEGLTALANVPNGEARIDARPCLVGDEEVAYKRLAEQESVRRRRARSGGNGPGNGPEGTVRRNRTE